MFPKPAQDCRVRVGWVSVGGSGGGVGGWKAGVIDPMASQRSGRVPGSFLFCDKCLENILRVQGVTDSYQNNICLRVSSCTNTQC